MKLPNPEQAVVDIAKLRDYCLSRRHTRGRHKARVFASVLGIGEGDAGLLREALLDAARNSEATPVEADRYGRRYLLDFELSGPGGRGTIRSSWIVLAGENVPRLISCYVL